LAAKKESFIIKRHSLVGKELKVTAQTKQHCMCDMSRCAIHVFQEAPENTTRPILGAETRYSLKRMK